MPPDDLADAFKQAAEIAKTVPDHLQEAAFNRALDAILGQTARSTEVPSASTKRKPAKVKAAAEQEDAKADPAVVLLEHMDSTAYPQVHDASKILDKALVILRAARDDFKIDGLSSPQIARVLTEKFRHKTSKQAVQIALASAGRMVDRVTPPSGAAYFRIMRPGEAYLDNPPKPSLEGEKKKKRRRSEEKTTLKSARTQPAEPTKATIKKRGTSTKGAYAVVTELLSDGFFKTPRTLSAIIEHAANNLGYHLKTNELPAPLLRYLRDKKLKRAKNSDKQFEYSEA